MTTTDQATLDFLRWVADHDATYTETWEVWQTSCPRHSTWEDAFAEGLVRIERPESGERVVVLTELGRAILSRP